MNNVKELRENLVEKVIALGISDNFKDNPAFSVALAQIDKAISQMNMGKDAENVQVTEENGQISFSWTSKTEEKYSMTIECHTPETFTCTTIKEKAPFMSKDGQTIRQKSITEDIATIDNSGFITLTTNGALLDNINCNNNQHNASTWAEQKYYTSQGVMQDREYKGFAEAPKMIGNIERTGIENLVIPREAFSPGSTFYNNYEIREQLQRQMLDTARLIVDDKRKGIQYNATVLLKQEHGLRDMNLQGGYNPYPKEIIINPLSPEEIEAKIERESNPKVAEGLREYAKDRETYSYNSNNDPHFVAKGISELEEMLETKKEEETPQIANTK